jgi:siroheme synthase
VAGQRFARTTLTGLPATLAEEVRPPAVWVAGDDVGLGVLVSDLM